jgi:hypothetical protein
MQRPRHATEQLYFCGACLLDAIRPVSYCRLACLKAIVLLCLLELEHTSLSRLNLSLKHIIKADPHLN